jgi:hypothetical protein
LVYHNRNRTLSPTLGRFLQSDPNASGVGLVSSVSMHGMSTLLSSPGVDLGSMTADGGNLYQYTQSNPISRSDPTGLFSGFDAYMEYNEGVAEHGVDLGTYATELLQEYGENLEDLAEAALDWNTSDRDFALLLGLDMGPENPRARPGGGVERPGNRYHTGGMFAAIDLETELAAGGDGQSMASAGSVKRAAKWANRAAKSTKAFKKWLNKPGPKERVYVKAGEDYVGRSKKYKRREKEHGVRLDPITPELPKNQCRAIENLIIKRNPHFTNQYRSISPRHTHYLQAEKWAIDYCNKMGIKTFY